MRENDLPRVKDIVESTLRERCGNVFELIAVRPDFDEYGGEILVIKAVFNMDRLGSAANLRTDPSPAIQSLRTRARMRFPLFPLSPNPNCGTGTLKPSDIIDTARDLTRARGGKPLWESAISHVDLCDSDIPPWPQLDLKLPLSG